MKSVLIKDTTKQERIALIKEWLPPDDGLEECEIRPIIMRSKRWSVEPPHKETSPEDREYPGCCFFLQKTIDKYIGARYIVNTMYRLSIY